jgi:flagellar basal-body rod protein FlgC
MLRALDISVAGMVAQRTRLNVISSNIANVSTTHNEQGEPIPYQPRFAVFESLPTGDPAGAMSVRVASIETDFAEPVWKYQPHHPDAIRQGPRAGFVAYPGIDITTEMVDALEATRAYEANVGVAEITRDLAQQTLRILV